MRLKLSWCVTFITAALFLEKIADPGDDIFRRLSYLFHYLAGDVLRLFFD
jgi:hypothetical protein